MRSIRFLLVIVAAAAVVAALSGLSGCGYKPTPSTPPSGPAVQDAASQTPPAAPSQPTLATPAAPTPPAAPIAKAPTAVPPGAMPSTPSAATPPAAKTGGQDILARIDELKKQPLRSREEAVTNRRSVMELADKLLASNPEPSVRDQARTAWLDAATTITASEMPKAAARLLPTLDKIADQIIAESPDSVVAAQAHYAKIVCHLNVERDGSENDPKINRRLFDWAKQFAEKFPTEARVNAVLQAIGQNAEGDGQADTAKEVYAFLMGRNLPPQIAAAIQSSLAKLEMIGKPMAIAGPTLKGGKANIDKYRGKVVLVDFWASWCPPCVQEMPNVQKIYDKYHDQGFEILAVSLDNGRKPLEKFVAEKKIRWTQIYFDKEGQRGWASPVGRQYGINSIPATFLIDREGKLAKIGVRGPTLEPAVVALLKQPAPAAKPTETAKADDASESGPVMREWTDTSGQFRVEAELVQVAEGKVTLKKPGGAVVNVPVERLSQQDQDWIRDNAATR